MVSKAAVIAIVAILAVPILLGYALNVEQVTETEYKKTDDTVDVSQLLMTGSDYTYAAADIYELNTKFDRNGADIYPLYQSQSTTKTPLKLHNYSSNIQSSNFLIWYNLSDFYKHFFMINYTSPTDTGNYLAIRILFNDNHEEDFSPVGTVNQISSSELQVMLRSSNGDLNTYTTFTNVKAFVIIKYGNPTGTFQESYDLPSNNNYINISGGFYLNRIDPQNTNNTLTRIQTPPNLKSYLLTMDLNTITASSHIFKIRMTQSNDDYLRFVKTTDSSGIHWSVYWERNSELIADLYYDQNASSNTYQIYMDRSGGQFRYVGAWPVAIGYANYYLSYDFDWIGNSGNLGTPVFQYAMTPKLRVDAAEYRAFEYPIIENKNYDASIFKTNPITEITNVRTYGSSIAFAGNTYTISKGNITIGSHDISVNGLALSSVPNPEGGYDNKIGNTIISTTAAPSTITFNGKWSANIITTAQEDYETTKMEWKAGDFAWDGIDHNFIMAGLLASLGAFVGVGIYARRTKSSVWPLLIVCGGAALLFFVML